MTEPAPDEPVDTAGTGWEPPSPYAALAPGLVLLTLGLWVWSDGGPPALGFAMLAVGTALLLTGAVAQGVLWGLDLHRSRRG